MELGWDCKGGCQWVGASTATHRLCDSSPEQLPHTPFAQRALIGSLMSLRKVAKRWKCYRRPLSYQLRLFMIYKRCASPASCLFSPTSFTFLAQDDRLVRSASEFSCFSALLSSKPLLLNITTIIIHICYIFECYKNIYCYYFVQMLFHLLIFNYYWQM